MEIVNKSVSRDGSVKFLMKLSDQNTIEILYMNDKSESLTYNSTVCVSSQVGCKIGCEFCATGKQGFVRNLDTSEIVSQVSIINSYCKEERITPIKAVVFAGMGEPLLNYENVKMAIEQLYESTEIKNFELATVGIVPGIHQLINDFRDKDITIRLNLSLHASTDEVRDKLIPINSLYRISDILETALEYSEAFSSKVRVRYMLIKGLNDTELDISRLSKLLENKPFKLVISAYNNNNIYGLSTVTREDMERFHHDIKDRVESDLFVNFGSDIGGGCGQLRQNLTQKKNTVEV